MERLLARLERRFGRFAIPNLTYFIAAGMALVFVLTYARANIEERLMLDMTAVKHGEVWRLVTYLFLPPPPGWFPLPRPILMMFGIYFVWMMGTNLEQEWGAFKLNAFYIVGMLGTTAVAALTDNSVGNFFLLETLFLAYATVFPDAQILFMFVLPVKVKWLGWIAGAGLLYQFAMGGWADRAAIGAASANYILFFAGFWSAWLRDRNVRVRQAARRANQADPPKATGGRVCAICGAQEDNGADIRVCSCAKCGGPRTLCLEHARNH
jgi:hypothetical protein